MVTPAASGVGARGADGSRYEPDGRRGQSWSPQLSRPFDADRTARTLGWVSVLLGSVELLAPGALARAIGAGRSPLARAFVRVCGLREMVSGVGILTTPRPAGWVTSRVVGDLTDLALLTAAFAGPRARPGRLLAATTAVASCLVLDAKCAQHLSGRVGSRSGSMRFRKRVTVNRPADVLYRFWREFSNQPRFMQRVESVRIFDERRSHWIASTPAGLRVEWDSEITDDRPGERIAWRSLPGSPLEMSGVVAFEPAGANRGTQVTVELEYVPPGGHVTAQLLKIVGQSPEQQLQEDLRRFKRLMETGQILVSDAGVQGAGPPRSGGRARPQTRLGGAR